MTKRLLLMLFLWIFSTALADDISWRGVEIAKENRCTPYNRETDYTYPESLEEKIVESLGNKIYSPYSETFFNSTDETDIEHIVSLSEAHDSGLCSASPQEKSAFASDLRNLTLASPSVNRYEKSGHDATNWLPEKNQCWYAGKVLEVKRAYKLSVDSMELVALEKVLATCSSLAMTFPTKSKKENENDSPRSRVLSNTPPVKKSRSNICHLRESSPHYFRTKNFRPFNGLKSCLNSGGRCPKRDAKCRALSQSVKSEK